MKFEKKYFISRKNLVFMARDIEKDIYAERFYVGVVNIAGGQEVSTGYRRRYGPNRSPEKGDTKIVCARPEEGSVVALRATGGSSNDPIPPERPPV